MSSSMIRIKTAINIIKINHGKMILFKVASSFRKLLLYFRYDCFNFLWFILNKQNGGGEIKCGAKNFIYYIGRKYK
ncbi:hypothetical protein CN601_23230 [Bacillus sp. AFS017336]|nr:hypothetical protein CN692_11085 [Bacillus sp. AFS002410]PEK99650.1 hypothetical protein CN601_23230 [Bacillus sp. AFS017336]